MRYEERLVQSLATHLARAKQDLGVSWPQLATDSGLSVSGARKYLRGEGNLSVRDFYALASALALDPRRTLAAAELEAAKGAPGKPDGISRAAWEAMTPADRDMVAGILSREGEQDADGQP